MLHDLGQHGRVFNFIKGHFVPRNSRQLIDDARRARCRLRGRALVFFELSYAVFFALARKGEDLSGHWHGLFFAQPDLKRGLNVNKVRVLEGKRESFDHCTERGGVFAVGVESVKALAEQVADLFGPIVLVGLRFRVLPDQRLRRPAHPG